jgi:hypothetical protein
MRRIFATAVVLAFAGAACTKVTNKLADAGVQLPPPNQNVVITPPPIITQFQLPAVDLSLVNALPKIDGNSVLIEVGRNRIEVDPTTNDAITALGSCTDLITYCYAPPSKSLAACVQDAKACATATPWTESAACCPSDCKTAFSAEVAAGATPLAAFQKVFFNAPNCFPGVNALLETP